MKEKVGKGLSEEDLVVEGGSEKGHVLSIDADGQDQN